MAFSSRLFNIIPKRSITTGDFYTSGILRRVTGASGGAGKPETTKSTPTATKSLTGGGSTTIHPGAAAGAPSAGGTRTPADGTAVPNGISAAAGQPGSGDGAGTPGAGGAAGAPADGGGSAQPPGGGGATPPDGGAGGGNVPDPPSVPMVRPPIQIAGLHGAYATALYSAASKQDQLDIVEQDLYKIKEVFEKDLIFQKFLIAPDIRIDLKLEGVEAVKKLEITDLTYNLMKTLIQNRRVGKLLAVINAYLEMLDAHRGIVDCEIIAARPLKPEQKEKLLETLNKFLPGKTARTVEKTDESLVGGFMIRIGQQHINMSMLKIINQYEALIRLPV